MQVGQPIRLIACYCWYVTLRCDHDLWPSDLDLWPVDLGHL